MSKTPISDEELKRLYETLSTQKIGGLLGRNPEGIRKRLHKLGVKMRPRGSVRTFTPSREELEAEYQTHSMRQIADKYGVGETVVWKRLKEFGIKLHDYENGGHRLRPGRIFSEEHRRKIGLSMRGRVGTLNRNWKGGKTAENIRLRGSIEYREWKSAALALHGFKCQECGVWIERPAAAAERKSCSTSIMSNRLPSSPKVASIPKTAKSCALSVIA